MIVKRGDIWWVDLPEPTGSGPGYRRPVIIVQADSFNRSKIHTVLAVVLTSNVRLAHAPGNVLLKSHFTGLPKDSAANVSQVVTLDKDFLRERIGNLPASQCHELDAGLRLILNL